MLICSYFCIKNQKHCREFKVLTFIVACVAFRVLALDRLKYHRKYPHSTDLIKEHHALGKKTNEIIKMIRGMRMMYYIVCDRGLARSEQWDVKFLVKVVNKIDRKRSMNHVLAGKLYFHIVCLNVRPFLSNLFGI